MKLTLTALTVAATMFASSASAFDPDDLQRLRDTSECYKCDLSEADLRGAFLREADISDADLSGADLTNANLSRATMKGVTLCNTNMPDGSVIYNGC